MSIDYGKILADLAHLLPKGPIADRLEIGTEALEALRRTIPASELPSDMLGFPIGIRVTEKPDMSPYAWRLYDTEGNLMRAYPEEQHG